MSRYGKSGVTLLLGEFDQAPEQRCRLARPRVENNGTKVKLSSTVPCATQTARAQKTKDAYVESCRTELFGRGFGVLALRVGRRRALHAAWPAPRWRLGHRASALCRLTRHTHDTTAEKRLVHVASCAVCVCRER